jgi:hypothetical protein
VGLLVGCGQNPFALPTGGAGGGNTAGGNGPPLGLAEKIKKKIDFLDYSNEMSQLAKFYVMYDLEFRHPPKTVKEFQDYIKKDSGQLVKWMNDGYYVVLPNIKPTSNTIIVYQNKDLKGGTRWVALGDASIQELTETEFAQQLKNQQQP